ncbi:MAG TPA: pyruvate kinase [Alphaproteobacteria bacterium]|nr:pyruvate kinase [Alphaproteobacteria bacterium]
MRRRRKAKIVATLGPASSSYERIRALFEAGADVFRLNFSHGSQEDHKERMGHIRELEKETGRPIGVLMDLQGPKLRIGRLEGGRARLTAGQPFRLDLSTDTGNAQRAPLPHPEIFASLEPGAELLLDDGKLRLRVIHCGLSFAECEVLIGGELSDRKGVNVPGAVLPISSLTEKDRADLAFGLDLGVDWVGLSFVQRPEDIAEARKLIAGRAGVLAKLEKPAAIERLEEIVELVDSVMVARGDLGVELPPEDVPSLQRQIVRVCRFAGRPVIIATQMLESMIHAPTPTRAEASDVATAVYEGADAVMLSAETASGEYPVEAVAMMDRIVSRVERDPRYRRIMDAEHPDPEATPADAITAAARQVANTISAAAIVTYTTSGSTALRASRERPDSPILCLTPKLETARRLAVAWGTHCVHTEDVRSVEEMVEHAGLHALTQGIASKGDRLVITAGMPFGTPGATNTLRISWVTE